MPQSTTVGFSPATCFSPAQTTRALVGEMERLHDLASLMRSHPAYEAPESITETIRDVIRSGDYMILE
jgi:hypothetical protein